MANCPDYIALRTPDGTALGIADLPERELRRLLHAPDALLWRHLDQPVKLDHACLMVEAKLPLRNGPVRVAYKRYRPRTWLKGILARFRRSPARRSWRRTDTLAAHQIPTARPLVLCEPRGGGVFRPSFLATEWIADAENLHLWGWGLQKRPLAERLRRAARCAERLGELVGRMHAEGLFNRDLKAANLLVVERENQAETYLIDADGVRRRRQIRPRRRVADLARLAVGLEAHPWLSRTVSYRFLRAYAAQFPQGKIAVKPLWRAIAARSERIARRMRRHGEQVL